MRVPAIIIVFGTATIGCLAIAHQVTAQARPPSVLPYPDWTPGDVRTTDATEACTVRTSTVRHVTGSMKRRVGALYRVEEGGAFVYDHLVPLSLGGSNSEKNLWPEPRGKSKLKDRCENRARSMVCSRGTLTLAEAQAGFSKNYIDFCKSIGVEQ